MEYRDPPNGHDPRVPKNLRTAGRLAVVALLLFGSGMVTLHSIDARWRQEYAVYALSFYSSPPVRQLAPPYKEWLWNTHRQEAFKQLALMAVAGLGVGAANSAILRSGMIESRGIRGLVFMAGILSIGGAGFLF